MRIASVALGILALVALLYVSQASEPARAASPTNASNAASTRFEVDPVHSSVVFSLRYLSVCDFHGRFNKVSGTFDIDPDDITRSTFDFVLDAESVSSGNDQRDGHLRSPDFFDAKKHPEIRFKSTKIEKSDSGALTVHGDLTFHGVTRPVKAEVRYGGIVDGRRGKRAGFDGVLKISRKEFGVTFREGMLGDEVTIRAGITGVERD